MSGDQEREERTTALSDSSVTATPDRDPGLMTRAEHRRLRGLSPANDERREDDPLPPGEAREDRAPAHASEREPRPRVRVLFVCTGNVCRSPYMERVLRHELGGLGVEVASAGTSALVGEPIDEGSAALLEARGVGASQFTARALTAAMITEADLVLTATRDHRRVVAQQAPFALRKVFTLLDFGDLVDGADVTAFRGTQANWLADLVAAAGARRAMVAPRLGSAADIVDPFRGSASVFAQMEAQSRPALDAVIDAVRKAAGADSPT